MAIAPTWSMYRASAGNEQEDSGVQDSDLHGAHSLAAGPPAVPMVESPHARLRHKEVWWPSTSGL